MFLGQGIMPPRGLWTYLGPKVPTGYKAQIVRDSQYLGRGSSNATALDLMLELGLVYPTISTAIRLWKMGFISRSYLSRYPKEHAPSLGTYSSIQLSTSR